MIAVSICARRSSSPSVWRVPHSGQWWDGVLRSEDGLWWKSNFRMTKYTFLYLCNKLWPFIQKQARCENIKSTTVVIVSLYALGH